jgi:hypothetical protein
MCRSRTKRACRVIAAAAGLGVTLGACSDIYYDRRDTIALSAGDAVATNKVLQMVDPWPRHSANKNLAFNGQRMQSAVERYRNNKVIPPVNATTSSVAYQQAQQAAASATSQTQSTTGGAAPAGGAPVK